ncbi:hypothetical protein EJ03DRAFT_309320 [Teratosphaeria nubilosa]|uniref:FCP1 homology domain-containing protein n=1 Tax=Teratosphaeria nubilosa TaxID=161662 RepID=A0A6G1LEM3_9PEZI|nr:hypothetical protein EJ03DRAFT_309320 [Teratosphaeria nubilosa]
MNILNIVSTPPATPPGRSRTASSANVYGGRGQEDGSSEDNTPTFDAKLLGDKLANTEVKLDDTSEDEKTPLLERSDTFLQQEQAPQKSRIWSVPKRIANAILYCGAVIVSTVTAPGRYVIACFYDEEGHFSAVMPLRSFRSLISRRRRKTAAQAVGVDAAPGVSEKHERSAVQRRPSSRRSPSVDSTASASSAATSDAESEKSDDSPARHTRSKSAAAFQQREDSTSSRRANRVRLQPNEEALRKRRLQRAQARRANPDDVAAVASSLKSPSSPAVAAKSRYPRAPAPPRPLVPRRQPSYTLSYSAEAPKKTLIIDLDETLIHSMAKGGRMSTGHMVEVRLSGAVSSTGASIGPGVPILYYVHERPGCHDFLRKVAKWYNLIVFTASVQEYADPVIDWLERERKYFSGRYYRQHCTFRNGAYIKDLAQVEPDLSRVMILDNSPMSYIFHEDNAIPIEGWISDPTDNDLLHLVPLLEGLQYVTDVRALLALRQGQAQQA